MANELIDDYVPPRVKEMVFLCIGYSQHKCPICTSPMIERQSDWGVFLGCSRYPICDGKLNADGTQGRKKKITTYNEMDFDPKYMDY